MLHHYCQPINVSSFEHPGFGDHCMAATFVAILRDNHVNAYLCQSKHSKFFDVPVTQCKSNFDLHYITRFWDYKQSEHVSIIRQNVNRINKNFKILRNFVPVKFKEEKIEPVDVVLCTKCSGWSDIRGWRYFDVLKKRLDKNKITWIDLDKNKIYGNLSLNYVKYAKVYVGLDTGRSHYSSFFANKKGIIIQSGHTHPEYWSIYDYIHLKNDCCKLSPCFLRIKDTCHYHNRFCCMDISANRVFNEIVKRINYKKVIGL